MASGSNVLEPDDLGNEATEAQNAPPPDGEVKWHSRHSRPISGDLEDQQQSQPGQSGPGGEGGGGGDDDNPFRKAPSPGAPSAPPAFASDPDVYGGADPPPGQEAPQLKGADDVQQQDQQGAPPGGAGDEKKGQQQEDEEKAAEPSGEPSPPKKEESAVVLRLSTVAGIGAREAGAKRSDEIQPGAMVKLRLSERKDAFAKYYDGKDACVMASALSEHDGVMHYQVKVILQDEEPNWCQQLCMTACCSVPEAAVIEGLVREELEESDESDWRSRDEKMWHRSMKPRVSRSLNKGLVAVVGFAFISVCAVFWAAFANILLNFFFAMYSSWSNNSKATAFFFTIACLYMAYIYSMVFKILFKDYWRYVGLAWASRFDERLREFLWDKLVPKVDPKAPQGTEPSKDIDPETYDGWWYISLTQNKTKRFCGIKLRQGNLLRLWFTLLVIVVTPIAWAVATPKNDNWTNSSAMFIASFFASAFACGLTFLSICVIIDYIYTLVALNSFIVSERFFKTEEMIDFEKRFPRIAWLFWTNQYLAKCDDKWRIARLITELFVAPLFCAIMFVIRDSSVGAFFMSLIVPYINYWLNALYMFKYEMWERDTKLINKEKKRNPEGCCWSTRPDGGGEDFEDAEMAGEAQHLVEKDNVESEEEEEESHGGGAESGSCEDECKKYWRISRDWCWGRRKMWVVLIVVGSLMLSLLSIARQIDHAEPDLEEKAISAHYPICNHRFFFGDHVFGPTEMTYFTGLAYRNATSRRQSLDYMLGPEYFNMSLVDDTNDTSSYYHFEAYSQMRRELDHYVVIRGTANAADALQDMKLWSEISSLQMVNIFFPLLTFWPIDLTRNFVKGLSLLQGWIGGREMDNYIEEVYEYVVDILPPPEEYVKNPKLNREKVVTLGHSLGGGLSSIIAAREYEQYRLDDAPPRVTSFGLSPPGTVWSSKKFGFSWQAVEETATAVWSRRDVVPMVDSHAGLIERIPCWQKTFPQCHSALTTICELFRQCEIPVAPLAGNYTIAEVQKRRQNTINLLSCVCCGGYPENPLAYCSELAPNQSWSHESCSCEGDSCPETVSIQR